jgi:hypothetical protein
MPATPVPAVNLRAALMRAAVAYGTLAAPLDGIEIPLRVAMSVTWENGVAHINIGDADAAERVAHTLHLDYQPHASTARVHNWSGTLHDQPVIVTGHGPLGTNPDVLRLRARAAARRKLDLLVPAARTARVIDVTA